MAVAADSILVRTSKGEQSIDRPSIREIRLPKQASYKWRIIGTAVRRGDRAGGSESHFDGNA